MVITISLDLGHRFFFNVNWLVSKTWSFYFAKSKALIILFL